MAAHLCDQGLRQITCISHKEMGRQVARVEADQGGQRERRRKGKGEEARSPEGRGGARGSGGLPVIGSRGESGGLGREREANQAS